MTASDILSERLIDWDVSAIFGPPGDGITKALRTRQGKIFADVAAFNDQSPLLALASGGIFAALQG